MARIRTIKPDFWKHEDISELSPECCLLAIGILNYADDEGYFNANPKLIEAELFPLRKLKTKLEDLLLELANIGYIQLATSSSGKAYGKVVNFDSHQKVNRPYPSKIKGLAQFTECSVNVHGTLSECSLLEKEKEKEKEKELVDIYVNKTNKKIIKVDSARKNKIRAFLKSYTIEQWSEGMAKVVKSEFLQSEWTAWDIDWLMTDKNFQKLMQGNYDKKQSTPLLAKKQRSIQDLTPAEKEHYGY